MPFTIISPVISILFTVTNFMGWFFRVRPVCSLNATETLSMLWITLIGLEFIQCLVKCTIYLDKWIMTKITLTSFSGTETSTFLRKIGGLLKVPKFMLGLKERTAKCVFWCSLLCKGERDKIKQVDVLGIDGINPHCVKS